MTTIRSYSNQSYHASAAAHPTSPILSASLKSTLPLPKSLKENRSFANLAKFLGISGGGEEDEDSSPGGADADDGAVEEDPSDVVDEESLMWDAQTALIAHQPSLAIQYYTAAALPPHRSAPACLALGNLLARGSSLLQNSEQPVSGVRSTRSSEQSDQTIVNGQSTVARIRAIFFSSSPPANNFDPAPSPIDQLKPVAVGWGIPRLGNKAVRDVEGMGIASAWFVLGLGWIVETEATVSSRRGSSNDETISDEDGNGVLVLSLDRSNPRAKVDSSEIEETRQGSSPDLSHTDSEQTDSTVIKTPFTEDGTGRPYGAAAEVSERSEYDQLKLLYNLLCPLVSLYRHGQIQEHDPVYLPPIIAAQLPACLQPQGDLEKRRNAWHLGAVVAKALLQLHFLKSGSLGKGKGRADSKMDKRRTGVAIMATYLLGVTSTDNESYFRRVVDLGECGLDMADELVLQAARRVDLILRSSPSTASLTSPNEGYPFPHMTKAALVSSPNKAQKLRGKAHSRMSSMASTKSSISVVSSRLLTSMKSTASLASMTITENERPSLPSRNTTNQSLAMDSLRRIRASSARPAEVVNSARWPSLSAWSLKSARITPQAASDEQTPLLQPTSIDANAQTLKHKASGSLPTPKIPTPPCIRSIASSPNVGIERLAAIQADRSGQSTPRRRLPFEPSDSDSINTTIDPELAAAELRSALTKQVTCGVCSTKGVNFPECRKCGLTFCSRTCRVDIKKGGDGKKHVCGAWESRKFLTVPVPPPRQRRKSVAKPSPLSVKA